MAGPLNILKKNTKSFKMLKNSKDFIPMIKCQGLLEGKKKAFRVNKVKMPLSASSSSFPYLTHTDSPYLKYIHSLVACKVIQKKKKKTKNVCNNILYQDSYFNQYGSFSKVYFFL